MASTVATQLHEQVQRTWHEIEQITLKASDERRNFSEDEQRQVTDLHAELDRNDTRLKDVLAMEKRNAETNAAFDALAARPANPAMTRGVEGLEGFAAEARSFVSDGHIDIATGKRKSLLVPSIESRIMRKLSTGRPMSPTEVRVLTDGYVGNVPNTAG